MTQLTLSVNRTEITAELDPEMPLLWALRDLFNLTGTKYGCGIGQCGCCTVHLNGVAVRSCQLTCKSVQGMELTTIEGLAKESLHPVQKAWCDENVAQCGYCQAGQIMSAVALLNTTPSPSDSAIETAMSGNLCRCGTYKRIKKAIKRAAAGRLESIDTGNNPYSGYNESTDVEEG